jgi:hypothetical protein
MKNIRCIENGEFSQRKLTSNKRKVFNAETEIKNKKKKTSKYSTKTAIENAEYPG